MFAQRWYATRRQEPATAQMRGDRDDVVALFARLWRCPVAAIGVAWPASIGAPVIGRGLFLLLPGATLVVAGMGAFVTPGVAEALVGRLWILFGSRVREQLVQGQCVIWWQRQRS